MKFEWKILPGFKTTAIFKEIQNKMCELQCDPAGFKDRTIFMSMFNDIGWEARGNEERFLHSHWSFLLPGSEKVVRNLRWHTKWILDANSGENATEL